VYASQGPFAVGYTTLHLADRDVAVWYPADGDAVTGKAKATYDQTTPLPDNLKGLVPAEFNTVTTMNAFADVAASTKGPFPIVLFSHGAGGYRLINSALDIGIASWGFVVVSADYLERGLVAQVTGAGRQSSSSSPSSDDRQQAADRDRTIMFDSLDLVERAPELKSAVDGSRVAAVGHSAGGNTAFNALNDPRVAVAVGWAPVAPTGPPANKPTMIIGAGGDIALTPDVLTTEFTSFAAPKRFVEIGGPAAGHNTFTDLCDVIRTGKGLVEFARKNNLISGRLLDLAVNGCNATDLEPARFFGVVQHFTVAELRAAFGIDPSPVGLDDSITTAFGDIPVQYRHDP
jgi:dienelactone hydrolase